MPVSFESVAAVVRERTNYAGPLSRDMALQTDLGVYGDDLDTVIVAWAEQFGVDISTYRSHFHTPEEGFNPGGLVIPPPSARVREIPITLGMLHDFAGCGAWGINYTAAEREPRRPDILVNRVLVVVGVGGIVVWLVRAGCG